MSDLERRKIISWLEDFIAKEKYEAFPEWSAGIEQSSGPETIARVNEFLNNCALELKNKYSNGDVRKSELIEVIKRHSDELILLDTEDREFALEILGQIAATLGLERKAHLQFLSLLDEIQRDSQSAEKINFQCNECGANFVTYVWSRNISKESRWLILRCFSCKEIDYKELPAGIDNYSVHFADMIAEYNSSEYPRTVILKLIEELQS